MPSPVKNKATGTVPFRSMPTGKLLQPFVSERATGAE
jgi:hypothetical protein